MDRPTIEQQQRKRIAELRQGALVLTGLYRSAEEDVDFWHKKTESLTREVVRLNEVLEGLCPFCGGTRDSPSHLGCPDLERALVEVERLEAIEYEARIVTQELRARNARLESLAASRLRRIHELTNVKKESV